MKNSFNTAKDLWGRESPFSFKNGSNHTPIPLFADSVKRFSSGVQRISIRSLPAQPKLSDLRPIFATPLFSYSKPLYMIPLPTGNTRHLSRRCREQSDPTPHRPDPPPVQVSFRQQ